MCRRRMPLSDVVVLWVMGRQENLENCFVYYWSDRNFIKILKAFDKLFDTKIAQGVYPEPYE